MDSARPVTDEERMYVQAVYPRLPVAKIARNLERSRPTVYKVIEGLGLAKSVNGEHPHPAPEPPPGPCAGGDLERLVWLRDSLREALEAAEAKSIPALAREYRATIEAIRSMEGGEDDGARAALDAIVSSISRRVPA